MNLFILFADELTAVNNTIEWLNNLLFAITNGKQRK